MGSSVTTVPGTNAALTEVTRTTVVTAVATAIADAEGVDVTDLDVCLYDSIDLDAVETLFESAARSGERWSLTFTVDGYLVTVDSDGDVTAESCAA